MNSFGTIFVGEQSLKEKDVKIIIISIIVGGKCLNKKLISFGGVSDNVISSL